ncbi:ferredoxin [Streptomyces sp. B21-083]|uniref:ferredoxin n=1 Tax=Streptomyces sp. B21-083 TaxID=3039410 RepID=UPI002FF21F14
MTDRKYLVTVDHELCVGNATCLRAAPRAFELNEGGQSEAVAPDTETRENLLEAVLLCPMNAISVTEVETGQRLEPEA